MKKRSLFMAFAAMLAIGWAILPSALNAISPKVTGHYPLPACDKTRDCPGGLTFCGYTNADCTGTILNMAP